MGWCAVGPRSLGADAEWCTWQDPQGIWQPCGLCSENARTKLGLLGRRRHRRRRRQSAAAACVSGRGRVGVIWSIESVCITPKAGGGRDGRPAPLPPPPPRQARTHTRAPGACVETHVVVVAAHRAAVASLQAPPPAAVALHTTVPCDCDSVRPSLHSRTRTAPGHAAASTANTRMSACAPPDPRPPTPDPSL